jgi:DNA-binding GntR family transcriptional regulator
MQATGLSGFILQASRSAQVADFLRDSILAGKLKPGDRVVERTLAKSLGVGQTTVREALQVLEHEGLIYKKANTASFVTQFSAERITEIVEIRNELEPKAFALAHRKKTAELIEDLQRLVNNIDEGAAKRDYYHVLRNDLRFHEMVWRAAGNQTLEQILSQLCTRLFAFLMVILSTSNSPLEERVRSHQLLVDALKGSDEEKVLQTTWDHSNNSWREWSRFIPHQQNGA